MNLKLVIFGVMYFGSFDICEAQYYRYKQKDSRVAIYGEAGLHVAGQASINIEGRIYSNKTTRIYGRLGYGVAVIVMYDDGSGVIGGFTLLKGKKNNHFEVNLGGFFSRDGIATPYSDNQYVLPLLDFGYRYQKPSGGFVFRIKAGILGAGIGIGYAF